MLVFYVSQLDRQATMGLVDFYITGSFRLGEALDQMKNFLGAQPTSVAPLLSLKIVGLPLTLTVF